MILLVNKYKFFVLIVDDKRLLNFLFGCKNSIERCKLILERYYSARTALPEFFAARDPMAGDIQESCDAV